MANDLFGGLGGLGGALGGLMGGLASELSDLQKQETDLLLEIGRQAYEQNPAAWPQHSKLQLIQQNIASAQATLNAAKAAQEQADAAKAAEDAKGRCTNCGHKNPEGVKFCQECGTPLAAASPKHCTSCGAELAAGTRFCGECGARQEG